MKYQKVTILLTCSFLLFFYSAGQAEIDWEVKNTFKTNTAPLDVASSIDGKWTFVLTKGGKLLVYSTSDGTLFDTLEVDPSMDRIDVSGLRSAKLEEKIFLSSQQNKIVQEILFEFIKDINIKGSPFLGQPEAPIAVVVFSDFE